MTDPVQSLEEMRRNLDAVIAGVEPIAEAMVVWRLLDSPLVAGHGTRLVGARVADRGFLDATILEDVARRAAAGTGATLVRITVPAGTRVAPIFAMTDSDEGDVLLARDTELEVTAAADGVVDMRVVA